MSTALPLKNSAGASQDQKAVWRFLFNLKVPTDMGSPGGIVTPRLSSSHALSATSRTSQYIAFPAREQKR
jgi:hypothetical protein